MTQLRSADPVSFKRRSESAHEERDKLMRINFRSILGGFVAGAIVAILPLLDGSRTAQTKKQPKAQVATEQTSSDVKPNILFIMGDDIGLMQPRIYYRGLMVGETPNIDRDWTGGRDLY